jgi:uncharacterized protein (TIGR02265 family)
MTSTNFTRVEAEELTPTCVQLTVQPLNGHIDFMKGCVAAVVTLTGGKSAKVETVEHDLEAERAVLRVSWE